MTGTSKTQADLDDLCARLEDIKATLHGVDSDYCNQRDPEPTKHERATIDEAIALVRTYNDYKIY